MLLSTNAIVATVHLKVFVHVDSFGYTCVLLHRNTKAMIIKGPPPTKVV